MADRVKLLTPKEIARMRSDVGNPDLAIYLDSPLFERIVATLEELIALSSNRLEDLIQAETERDRLAMDHED